MSLFNPEYEFTCQRCGHVWYMTSREIREAHRAAQNIFSLKSRRFGSLSTKKVNNLTSQIALLESTARNDKRCPCCGSRKISKVKA